ncbi:MAG: YebC/PmpR family DNA-binding transcriptional regulator [Lachnospiraceae bacterium]
MSGHSKFANIKHKKERNDAAKGKVFTKIGRELAVAVKEGGGPDPTNNSRLRDVIAKAKANNMPNDNIDRSIKKAAGDANSSNYERVTYEGYGPGGTAIIVDALTDNKNRTASNVRNAFTKGNGNVGTPGCVSFMFDQKGQIIIAKEECGMDADDLMMMAVEAGADDFLEEEDSYEILTAPNEFSEVRLVLDDAKIPMAAAEVTMIPQTWVSLADENDIKSIQKTLDLLDEDDDVQEVYHNWEE